MTKPFARKSPQTPLPMASFFPPDMKLKEGERHLDTVLLRYIANTAAFPALCRQINGGCYRTQRCRGEPRECVGRFIGLLPGDVWDWIEAALEGQQDRLTFDELVAEYPDEFEAITEWRAALARSCGR